MQRITTYQSRDPQAENPHGKQHCDTFTMFVTTGFQQKIQGILKDKTILKEESKCQSQN